MNDQSETQPATEAIVVCGTCDLVYRMHAGRTNCPHCGGEPSIIVTAIETPAEEPTPAAVEETPPPAAPAVEEPVGVGRISSPENAMDVSRGPGGVFPPPPAVEEPAQASGAFTSSPDPAGSPETPEAP